MDVEIPPEYCIKHFKTSRNEIMNIKDHPQLHYLENVNKNSEIILTEEAAKVLGIVQRNMVQNDSNRFITTSSVGYADVLENNCHRDVTSNSVAEVYENFNSSSTKLFNTSDNQEYIYKNGEISNFMQNSIPESLQQVSKLPQIESVKVEEQKEIIEDLQKNVIYRVVYPDELDLKPGVPKQKRGRPKRKLNVEIDGELEIVEEPAANKNLKTRSGRIVRPPQHIQKDFKKIDISDTSGNKNNFKLIDFDSSPKTNPSLTTTNVFLENGKTENHKRKRCIGLKYRCPLCKKVYLGHNQILKHFENNPNHSTLPDNFKIRYSSTWNYLIDLCNKRPNEGRGLRFCKELSMFVENLRTLAKVFFKPPADTDTNFYFVDSTLSSMLGINSGNYVLDENQLRKSLNLDSFLINGAKCKETVPKLNKNNHSNFDFNVLIEKCTSNEQNVIESNAHSYNFNNKTENFVSNIDKFNLKDLNTQTNIEDQSGKLQSTQDLPQNFLLNSQTPDLHINNIDMIQVTNIGDNNYTSDEVMNVEQLVNERYQNLTGSDLELPNTLDLQSLELFQFPTS